MSGKLAILGGSRVVPEGLVKPWPHVTDADREAVAAVLAEGNMPAQRQEQSEGLAREWAEYLGLAHAIPCNSGTAALHLAVAGVGIEPGDEVICPAFTYWATAAAVLHHNGIPTFVDIDPRTYCMDPALIEERITARTRAIMPVHIHGMPADMDEVCAIAAKHNLFVIEDCAQSHGARYKGQLCGTIGHAAGFSLQMSKLLTTGSEGGIFVTDDEQISKRAALLQYLGELVVPGREREDQEYNAYGLGWMYRGDVFGQAFARSQLKRLDENNRLRVANCELLSELLADVPGLSTPYLPDDRQMVYYTYTIALHPEQLGLDVDVQLFRDKAMAALRAEGVDVGLWQTIAVPGQEIFQTKVGYGKGCPWRCPHAGEVSYNVADYPVTNQFIRSRLYVHGVGPPNGSELMQLYAEAIAKVMANAKELVEAELPA